VFAATINQNRRFPMTFGPIDFIALEFKGNQFHGEIMSDLTELVSSEVIRILDLVVVKKDEHGEVVVRELQELEPASLQIFDPLKVEISGMVTVDDSKMIGELERIIRPRRSCCSRCGR
jgi:hypothetical protein